ncbi:glycosyl transferase family A [Sulfolobus acidocaldarius SUSAZ]|nr:glycosyl transferase family A [Sulfolobus acidocaldarius SUSAZ]
MFISVIITAYNRKDYLLNAVNSVVSQDFPRDNYEIVVIKNFKDEKIDKKLTQLNVKVFYSERRGSGEEIEEFLDQIQGEVVSFLDDDDEFLPGKLKYVEEVFNKGIDYLRNGIIIVNNSGKVLGTNGLDIVAKGEEDKRKFLLKLALGNSSSMSLRTEILHKTRNYLKEISLALDVFLYASSLLYGNTLVSSSKAFTKYRRHMGNSGGNLKSMDEYIEGRATSFLRSYNDLLVISKMLASTYYEKVVRYFLVRNKLEYRALPLSSYKLEKIKFDDIFLWLSSQNISNIRSFIYNMMILLTALSPQFIKRFVIGKLYDRRRNTYI